MVYNPSASFWGPGPPSRLSLNQFCDPSREITALSPALTGGREVPVPADGAAFITEGRVTPKAGSTFIIRGFERRATPSAARRRRWGQRALPRLAGTGAGSPKVCRGAIPCSPSWRQWPQWWRQGRGAPASADKGTPSRRQLGDKMSPAAAGCLLRSRPAELARLKLGCFARAPRGFAGAYFHFPDKIPSLAVEEGEWHQPPPELAKASDICVFIRVFIDSCKGWMSKQTPAPSSGFTHESTFAQ